MVGEIRDPETAEIAVQSALTGHLVYTTVHANNAIDVLGRFQHMGVDTYNLVSALNGVLATAAVRVICKTCSSHGCQDCRNTGFRGRKAIGELVVLNDEQGLIVARAPARKLKEAARAAGAVPLRGATTAGASRRNYSRGDQPCHFRTARKHICASAWDRSASWCRAARPWSSPNRMTGAPASRRYRTSSRTTRRARQAWCSPISSCATRSCPGANR